MKPNKNFYTVLLFSFHGLDSSKYKDYNYLKCSCMPVFCLSGLLYGVRLDTERKGLFPSRSSSPEHLDFRVSVNTNFVIHIAFAGTPSPGLSQDFWFKSK